ncbi:MAG TPA: adenylosuccinate lyase [Gammaproteobacteria bacterium]|nr:adenylosuccinate lyase [Gammaproteobacteria bacterium]
MTAGTDALFALSPLDGRYHPRTAPLRELLSEYGLIRARVRVELAWFRALASAPGISECPALSSAAAARLDEIENGFDADAAAAIKSIEKETNHDVKAVEYFLKERFAALPELAAAAEFLHFACTSEDINNLAWALVLDEARKGVLLPGLAAIRGSLERLARAEAATAMLARTHGQAATPTTLGKEIAVFAARIRRASARFEAVPLAGKLNGASGAYNAHALAYPQLDWIALARTVVEGLGLDWQALTTQIEPHDRLAELLDALAGANTILIDLCRDLWTYIGLGYFRQRLAPGEIGSSTMPHKVNPIDFENAEGNFGIANALARHLAATLPISRLQRDLTDSTAQRALGSVFGHTLVALRSLERGLAKLEVAHERLAQDLDAHWEVLGEAAQTLMRKHGVAKPYETLKAATRGRTLDRAAWLALVRDLPLPAEARATLEALTPQRYTGLAAELVRRHLGSDDD